MTNTITELIKYKDKDGHAPDYIITKDKYKTYKTYNTS